MAKTKKKAVSKAAPKKSHQSLSGVARWAAPFPEAKLGDDGADLVQVRAVPTCDIRVNGTLLAQGVETVLPCSVAHANAANLSAPRE